MVKFGIEFVPKEAYWKTVYYAIQAEKRGFDNLWITDHYKFYGFFGFNRYGCFKKNSKTSYIIEASCLPLAKEAFR